jgi:hypothetical protein
MTLTEAIQFMSNQKASDDGQAILDCLERCQSALTFIKDLSSECMERGDVRVGQAAEIAMRHIFRRADETL